MIYKKAFGCSSISDLWLQSRLPMRYSIQHSRKTAWSPCAGASGIYRKLWLFSSFRPFAFMLSIGSKVYDLPLASLLVKQPSTWEHLNLSQSQMARGIVIAIPRSVPPAMVTGYSCLWDATVTDEDVSTVTCNMRVSQSELICPMHPSLLV